MPRSVSMTFRAAMNAQETGEIPVALLTITHPDLDDPIYISGDPTERLTTDPLVYGTTSRSNDYLFIPFRLNLPDDHDETAPQASIEISNVMREHISLMRSIVLPAVVKMEIVLASDPDEVEITFPAFEITKVDYDANVMTMSLSMDPLITEPFPGHSFTPADFPGLFA
jgi:hypothetical protein